MFLNRLSRPLAAVTVAVLAGATFTACGSGSSASSGSSDSLVVASPYQINGLDPQGDLAADTGTQLAAHQIFSTLVSRKGTGFAPSLATSWTISNGGKTWTFTLRSGVKYSDGTPMRATDVASSVARVVKLGGPLAALWDGLKVTAPSDTSVVVTASTPQGALLSKLSTLPVLPSAEIAKSGFFNAPVGSGPYKVSSFAPGQTLTLVPNDLYWGSKPKLKRVVIRYISNTAARVTALKTGEIQSTWALPDDQVALLSGQDGLVTKTVPSDAQYTMWFNSSRPEFAKAEVRRALWQAVDFKSIISALYPTTGAPATAPISSTIAGHADQQPYSYNPEAAKSALTAAGFDFGKTYQLAYSGDEFTQFAQSVASDLAKIGVHVDPVNKEKAVYLDDLLALRWDINLQSLGDATGDADYVLGRLYTCEANRMGYCNHQLDSLLGKAASAIDPTQRNAYYAQAERIIWDDAVGMFPMDVKIAYNWRSSVSGLTPASNYQPDLSTVTVS